MGFSYEIKYKCGEDNLAADACSRVLGIEILCMVISLISSDFSSLIHASYQQDSLLSSIVHKLQLGESVSGLC